ncbi:sphingomyelin synthase-related protein 1-like [Ylistrum balloti]|uniref:sphingomyelin synthase-related protein 1-like n=1 Tax=Ylistrum balloti TaxID=509963 RepID=UPI002905C455|nr:sphingomyelin synthase-related protein 1-like [Ylistrum balloti]
MPASSNLSVPFTRNDKDIGYKKMGSKYMEEQFTWFATKYVSQNKDVLRKLIIGFLYLLSAHITSCVAIVFVNDRLPDRKKHPPLPDLILDNLPYVPWAGQASEYCLALEMVIWIGMVSLSKQRLQIIHRLCLVAGTMYWLRCLCVLVTSLPVPDVHKKCYPFPEADTWNKLKRALDLYTRFGLKVVGAETCGDYIFSGHTTLLTILNLFVNEYAPRSRCFIRGITWTLNIGGILFILLCRGHYTIDVILAFYLSYQIFTSYHCCIIKERTSSFPWKVVDYLSECFEDNKETLPEFEKVSV